jgi:hypothetical protein
VFLLKFDGPNRPKDSKGEICKLFVATEGKALLPVKKIATDFIDSTEGVAPIKWNIIRFTPMKPEALWSEDSRVIRYGFSSIYLREALPSIIVTVLWLVPRLPKRNPTKIEGGGLKYRP